MPNQTKNINCEQIEKLAEQFSTQKEIVGQLGVNINYISQRSKHDTDFREAFERGRSKRNGGAVLAVPETATSYAAMETVSAEAETNAPAAPASPERLQLNDHLEQLHINVRESMRLGYGTAAAIAKHLGEDEQTVENVIAAMRKSGKVEKDGDTATFFLTKKGESRAGETDKIISSLTKIKYQTARHLCINTGLSYGTIVDVLEILIEQREVLTEHVGSSLAYYLKANKPDGKLYNGGDHSLHVRPKEPEPEPAPGTPKVGDRVVLPNLNAFPEEKSRRSRYIEIKAEDVEDLAARGLKQKAIADELGVGYSTLQMKINENYLIREAYERGAKDYRTGSGSIDSTAPILKTDSVAPPVTAAVPKNSKKLKKTAAPKSEKKHGGARKFISVTPESLEKAARENRTKTKIASALGILVNTLFTKIKKQPELKEAFNRGRAASAQIVAEKSETKEAKPEIVEQVVEPQISPVKAEPAVEHFLDHDARSEENLPEDWKIIPAPKPANSGQVETDSRFSHTLERISANGHSKGLIERMQRDLGNAEAVPIIHSQTLVITEKRTDSVQTKEVSLANGKVFVGFEGDFFSMSKKERALLNGIADLVQEFQEEIQ